MIRTSLALASSFVLSFSITEAGAQSRPAASPTAGFPALLQTDQWRAVEPEHLMIIDTTKGRIIVALEPQVAPRHVERIQTLTRQGFYDGQKFHRVLTGFMAQTGDPQGTGEGSSDLPDLASEFTFRRGRGAFQPVAGGGEGYRGYFNSLPIQTQPDAQMFITADMKVGAHALFCPSVAGMARAGSPDSANSQFYLMTGRSDLLNSQYTAFGRVVAGLEVVKALNAGPESNNGAVGPGADVMTRVRLADAFPENERPAARLLDPRSPSFVTSLEAVRTAKGLTFNVCDVEVPAEVTGG